jgi:hypothetical protein
MKKVSIYRLIGLSLFLLCYSTILLAAVDLDCVQKIPDELGSDLNPDPFYKCLPQIISANKNHEPGFTSYKSSEKDLPLTNFEDVAQIGELDNRTEAGNALINKVFSQDHFVRIPKNAQILSSEKSVWMWVPLNFAQRSEVKAVWDYPTGTEFLHRIFINLASGPKLFEVRMSRKLKNGMWALGVYAPIKNNEGFLKLRTRIAKPLNRTFQIFENGQIINVPVRMKRLSPISCRECHSHHSNAPYQYGDHSSLESRQFFVGPCEFTPNYPSDSLRTWMQQFTKKFGYAPIRTAQ